MKKIFLSTEIPEDKTASSKAKVDVLEILEEDGYSTLYFPKILSVGILVKFWNQLSAIVTKDSHIVLEYPCWPRKRITIIYLFCLIKRIKLFGIIHDIGDLRFPDAKQLSDMKFLKRFDGLISHNAAMTKWLRQKGYKKKIVNLDAFDYKLKHPVNYHDLYVKTPLQIFYAGNLAYSKATYIYDKNLNKLNNIQLSVYGQAFEKEKLSGTMVDYKGTFNPVNPELPQNYHFGLVWEGTSLDTCKGQFGEYIRYNNPHKFSLYMAMGLPVIVWKEAAVARFVEKYNIGFTISNFEDLELLSAKVTSTEYAEYVSNIGKLADKVRSGYFLKTAIAELINE